jgi:DNA uptake protein ComE-like DNA-binding protein
MGLRSSVRNFFGFTRAQTHGVFVLLVMLFVALFFEPVWRRINRPVSLLQIDTVALMTYARQLDSLENISRADAGPPAALFVFNPNTATQEELLDLGFTPALARRLINYRSKGGTFRQKSDMLRLYGIDTMFYVALHPFIQLPEKHITEVTSNPSLVSKEKFDINLADTTQLKDVFGIGPVLSARIVRYRDKLGGFVSVHQVGEVYGVDSLTAQRVAEKFMVLPAYTPHRININAATEQELSAHPYFSRAQASALVAYRFQHGPFVQVADITKIKLFDSAQVEKLKPYVTVE